MEMITVSAIVATLLAIGVPSYRYVGNQNRMSMEVNSLLADLQYARSEALRDGKSVTTCVSTNGTSCTGGNAWGGGWVVYANPTGAVTNPTTATTLRVRTRLRRHGAGCLCGGQRGNPRDLQPRGLCQRGSRRRTHRVREHQIPADRADQQQQLYALPPGQPGGHADDPDARHQRGDLLMNSTQLHRAVRRLQPRRGHGVAGRDLRRPARRCQDAGAVAWPTPPSRASARLRRSRRPVLAAAMHTNRLYWGARPFGYLLTWIPSAAPAFTVVPGRCNAHHRRQRRQFARL